MQEKSVKISPIKQRILQFADGLPISKREFYARIGVSRGTLEAKTGITEDVLAKFIAEFPEISLKWLILGSGEMYCQNADDFGILDKNILAFIQSSQTQLVEQAELIGRLKERLSRYEKP
nr:MAG TPA: repressor protein CI [Caudoviricetes sp.]